MGPLHRSTQSYDDGNPHNTRSLDNRSLKRQTQSTDQCDQARFVQCGLWKQGYQPYWQNRPGHCRERAGLLQRLRLLVGAQSCIDNVDRIPFSDNFSFSGRVSTDGYVSFLIEITYFGKIKGKN